MLDTLALLTYLRNAWGQPQASSNLHLGPPPGPPTWVLHLGPPPNGSSTWVLHLGPGPWSSTCCLTPLGPGAAFWDGFCSSPQNKPVCYIFQRINKSFLAQADARTLQSPLAAGVDGCRY